MIHDPRIDAYIVRKADFARPILAHLREVVHAACPEAEETIKWGSPTFLYKGAMLAGMAAFKAHATFGFWLGRAVGAQAGEMEAMGGFGKLTSLADLPSDAELTALIHKAMALTDAGAKRARKHGPRPPIDTPRALLEAIDGNASAAKVWAAFSPSCRREYAEWVSEAKRDETRDRRVAQAVAWIAEGKSRNWKYQGC